jgi:hypothetical protein
MASKNRVQEASAAGIGRSISFTKINRANQALTDGKKDICTTEI